MLCKCERYDHVNLNYYTIGVIFRDLHGSEMKKYLYRPKKRVHTAFLTKQVHATSKYEKHYAI